MKCSFQNLAKTGLFLSLLAFSSSLQSAETQSLTNNIKSVELRHHDDHHHHHHHEQSLSRLTVLSEELWRTNAIFEKDSLQLAASGVPSFEIISVTDQISANAFRINNLIYGSTSPTSTAIQAALLTITLGLDSYIVAYRSNPTLLPTIIENLQGYNQDLYDAIVAATSTTICDRPQLRRALENRLVSLKQLAQAFISSQIGEFDDVYEIFNENLRAAQRVGKVVADLILENRLGMNDFSSFDEV